MRVGGPMEGREFREMGGNGQEPRRACQCPRLRLGREVTTLGTQRREQETPATPSGCITPQQVFAKAQGRQEPLSHGDPPDGHRRRFRADWRCEKSTWPPGYCSIIVCVAVRRPVRPVLPRLIPLRVGYLSRIPVLS